MAKYARMVSIASIGAVFEDRELGIRNQTYVETNPYRRADSVGLPRVRASTWCSAIRAARLSNSAMLDYPIRHVLVRHEQGATHMADGYARATGRVGVAVATSGPRSREHGHRHRHGDDGLIANRLHHRQVGSGLVGSDAFQETDITVWRLRCTKHNYLVTRASDVAAIREAFAASGRPVRSWSTSAKERATRRRRLDWDAAQPDLERLARPGHSFGDNPLAHQRRAEAADPGRARHRCRRSPRRRRIPWR